MPPTGFKFPPVTHSYTGDGDIETILSFHRREKLIGLTLTFEDEPGSPYNLIVTRTPAAAQSLTQELLDVFVAGASLDSATNLPDFFFVKDDILTITCTNPDNLDYLLEVVTEPFE